MEGMNFGVYVRYYGEREEESFEFDTLPEARLFALDCVETHKAMYAQIDDLHTGETIEEYFS